MRSRGSWTGVMADMRHTVTEHSLVGESLVVPPSSGTPAGIESLVGWRMQPPTGPGLRALIHPVPDRKCVSLSQDAAHAVQAPTRLPLVTYVLAAGVFLMGTSEFIVAGILPEIADDLGISIAQTGLMITVFAIGMIVGTPAMAALTLRLSRRLALGLSLIVFSIGHVIVAAAADYTTILAARFLTALATGGFWAVAAVVAAQTAGAAMSARAVGIVLGGGMVANVLGVPLGSFAGQAIGWRGPFWALAVLAFLGAFVIYRLIPLDAPTKTPPS